MDRDYVLIYTPYITRKGVRIWVSQYGLKLSSGGDKRDRTADLLNAVQALSQLSYTPTCLLFQKFSAVAEGVRLPSVV